jgi:hypothetical protein
MNLAFMDEAAAPETYSFILIRFFVRLLCNDFRSL